MDNIEKRVSEAILQNHSETIKIDGIEYPITSPTPATLILVSELVSSMPFVNRKATNIMYEVLRTAKDMAIVGKIVATLILGAKRIKEKRKVLKTKIEYYEHWSWRKFCKVIDSRKIMEEQLEIDYLAERLLEEVETKTLLSITANRLAKMQIADFFELTTSLSEANIIKRTREVEETVSGD